MRRPPVAKTGIGASPLTLRLADACESLADDCNFANRGGAQGHSSRSAYRLPCLRFATRERLLGERVESEPAVDDNATEAVLLVDERMTSCPCIRRVAVAISAGVCGAVSMR